MNRNSNHSDFESFLSDSIEGLKMYPSDRVWRTINQEINGPTRWSALYIAASITCGLVLLSLLFVTPDDAFFGNQNTREQGKPAIEKTKIADQSSGIAPMAFSSTHFEIEQNHPTNLAPVAPQHASTPLEHKSNVVLEKRRTESSTIAQLVAVQAMPQPADDADFSTGFWSNDWALSSPNETDKPSLSTRSPKSNFPVIKDFATISEINPASGRKSLVRKLGSKKWSVHYYAAPSISYRLLKEEKLFDKSGSNAMIVPANYFTDINSVVTHRSALGMETGIGFLYRITNKLQLAIGTNLAYRNYLIEGFKPSQPTLTSVRLNTSNAIDTVYALSEMNNTLGGTPKTLRSNSFQIGVPIGFRLNLSELHKNGLAVGASLQPTYNISKEAYLISADYKNYVNMPDMMRRFNLNLGVELLYRVGMSKHLIFEAGPQIRYQLQSSARNLYPVKEHPIDYSFKLALTPLNR